MAFNRTNTSVVLAGLAACALSLGCSKNEPQPNYAQQQQPYGNTTYPPTATQPYPNTGTTQPNTYGQPNTGTYGTPTATQPAPQPTTTTQPQAQGGACQPLDAVSAAPTGPVMQALAQNKVVAGSKPLGGVIAGNCQAGQSLESQFQASPGKCYTVVGTGVGVTELDLQLVPVSPIPGVAPVLAQDNTTGGQAVIGEKPNCWKWAFPIGAAVKVVVKATAGQGLVGAQVYEK